MATDLEAMRAQLIRDANALPVKRDWMVQESLCSAEKELAAWVERSMDYILSLPAPKPRRTSPKGTTK